MRVRKSAGVPDVKIHDLRKTFGTLLAQAGVSSLLIQNWMGHTDPTVTREHYIGLPEETKKHLRGLQRVLPAGLLGPPKKRRNKTVTKHAARVISRHLETAKSRSNSAI